MYAITTLLFLVSTSCFAQGNLVANGSFEGDAHGKGIPRGWIAEQPAPSVGTLTLDSQIATAGRQSLRIEHPEDSEDWVRANQDGIPARPSSLYRFDGWVRSTGPAVFVVYEFTPGDPERRYLTHVLGSSAGGDQWQAVSATFTTAEQVRTFRISCMVSGRGTAWFDDVQLVRVGVVPDGDAVAVEEGPVIDGRLDDPAWQTAPKLGPYFLLGGTGERPAAATWSKVVWTPTTLYIASSCDEPYTDRIRAAVTDDDGPVYTDDSVEVFLDPEGAGTGFAQFDANARGVRFDTRQRGARFLTNWYTTAGASPVNWHPKWTARASVEEGRWTVEMAIPFDSLGGTPQIGDTWGANFCRERYTQPELSTWAPLSGRSFLQPQAFGRLTFRSRPTSPPELLTRTAKETPGPLPLVPQPKEIARHRETADLGPRLRLQPRDEAAARIATGCAPLLGNAEVLPVGLAPQRDAIQLATLGTVAPLQDVPSLRRLLKPVAQAGGYQLLLAQGSGAIVSADEQGVRDGLMTLSILAQPTSHGYVAPQVEIRDWPDCAVRAWHVGLPGAEDGALYCSWVDALARLKYNTLMIEVDDNFRYESHPEIGRADAPTKEQVRAWVEYAKARGFEVIPQVAVFGHFGWVLDKPGWADLAEDPGATGNYGRWVANVRDPRYYPLVFDLFAEVIEVFQPTIFHIGHDEITFQPIGVNPMTRDIAPAELLAEEVVRLHEWLAARKLKTMMWGDQLLPEHNGGSPYFTAHAIDKLPKDILIADWHYDAAEQFPSVPYFKQHGFAVLACGWWEPLNVWNFPTVAVEEQVLGFSGTSWWDLARFPQSAEHQTAFVLAAENAWSNRQPAIDALGYRPGSVWRRLAGWGGPASETEFAPIDIAHFANQSIVDSGRRGGWLALGPEHDLSGLPRGLQWWDGVPYRIASRAPEAIVLAAEGQGPGTVRGIPVGTAAKALYFLQTCGVPAARTADIYERDSQYPKLLGHWLVTYEDGFTAEVPIEYRQTITDWNDGLPPAQASCVWSSTDASGAYVALSAYRWDNPYPDKVITCLDITSLDAPLPVAVLAVTAALR